MKNRDSYFLVLLFAIALAGGIFNLHQMKSHVDNLNDKVEMFINQDIEVEYNYFLWLHEREEDLDYEEMELYLKLKRFYKLPKEN